MDLEITYCQPCGHQPRAVELVNQLLASYGMPLNKKLTIALKPSDGGIFDVALDGRLVRHEDCWVGVCCTDDRAHLFQEVLVGLHSPGRVYEDSVYRVCLCIVDGVEGYSRGVGSILVSNFTDSYPSSVFFELLDRA